MAALSQQNEAKLRAAIAAQGLQDVEDLIVGGAAECAALSATERDDYSRPGNSRFGGRPDLPRTMDWPRDARNRRLSFLMQVNLSEVPPFEGKLLPDLGMLYVFAEDWEAAIYYSPVDTADDLLPAADSTVDDDDEEELSNPDLDSLIPYRLAIQAAVDLPEWTSDAHSAITDALEEKHDDFKDREDRYNALAREMRRKTKQWAGKLQGLPCWIGYVPDWKEWSEKPAEAPSPENGWTLLLLMDTNDDVTIMFGDAGYQLGFIQRDALKGQNFGNIFSQLESS